MANEWLACWSTAADTDTWTQFDTVTIGASDLTFSNSAPFPNGMIYIAALPMYPFTRIQRIIKQWSNDARVTATAFGAATWRDNGDGRSAGCVPYYKLALTNDNANTKNNMILAAFNHPSETPGPFQLEGAMAWLLGGSPEAEFLLDWFNVYVYPCLNPQGVTGGWFRSSPQTPADDNNRLWDSTGENEAIDAFKAAIAADTGSALQVGMDFHSTMDDIDGFMSTDDHTAGLYAVWLAKMIALDAGFSYLDSTIAESLRTYWTGTYSAPLALSCEYGGTNSKTPSNWKTQGQYALRSVAALHAEGRFTNGPGVGCRDFNGSTDRIDWSSAGDLTGSALTISAWINSDGFAGNSDYIFEIHQSGNTAIGMQFYLAATTNIYYQRGTGVTSVYRGVTADDFTGALTHVLVTHNGTLNDYTTIHIYVNGTEVTLAVTNQNGSSVADPTGSWSVGGRIFDDSRNFDGKISQVAV